MNCLSQCAVSFRTAAATGLSLVIVLGTASAQAQTGTVLAPGATNTSVTPSATEAGNQYDITGGALSSGPGQNLIHHFEAFEVGENDTANFVVSGPVENVVSLIESSDPARINGTLKITGTEASLYLVSPSGVLFGSEVQLALPADLTVTTADALQFETTRLAVEQVDGSFDPTDATGTPSAFVFSALEPAAIENQGSLSLKPGQSLTMLAGTVRNVGTLSVPGGTVNLAAVPGGYTVRLSRPGSLLSLELTPNQPDLAPYNPSPIGPETFSATAFDVTTLPDQLTGGSVASAGQMVENPDGSFSLVGAATQEAATVATAETATVATARDSSPNLDEVGTVVVQGTVDVSGGVGGKVSVVAPRVALIGADVTAAGTQVGGSIQIGSLPVAAVASEGLAPQNMDSVYVYGDRQTQLSANGINADSSGGSVYVWANHTLQYYGQATAAGDYGTVFMDGGVRLDRIVPRTRPARTMPLE